MTKADLLSSQHPVPAPQPIQPLQRDANVPITIALNVPSAEEPSNADSKVPEAGESERGKEEEKLAGKRTKDEQQKKFEEYVKSREHDAKAHHSTENATPSKPFWERGLESYMQAKRKKEEAKQQQQRKDKQKGDADADAEADVAWILSGIVVKIKDGDVADGKYLNKKAVIVNVIDTFVAEVRLLDSADIIRIDQDSLETVIPNIDGKVMMLLGRYRGKQAVMKGLYIDEFKASLELEDRKLLKVPYEAFSKLHIEGAA
jgi:hypothetical protein